MQVALIRALQHVDFSKKTLSDELEGKLNDFDSTMSQAPDATKIESILEFISAIWKNPSGHDTDLIVRTLDLAVKVFVQIRANNTKLDTESKYALLTIASTAGDLHKLLSANKPTKRTVRALHLVLKEKLSETAATSSTLAMRIPGTASQIAPPEADQALQQCIIFYDSEALQASKSAAMDSAAQHYSGTAQRKKVRERAKEKWRLRDLPKIAEDGGDGSGCVAWFTRWKTEEGSEAG